VEGERGHLGEVAHRRLASVVLPVGVGGEADGRVEGQVRSDGVETLRVEGQEVLQALNGVRHYGAGHTEDEQREGVANPTLLYLRIHGGQAVDGALERPHDWRQESALAGARICEHTRQVRAHWPGDGHQQHDVQKDMEEAR